MIRRTSLTLIAVLSLTVASCAVPTDESAQIIEQDRLDESLRNSTTTSTTTIAPIVPFEVNFYLLRQLADSEQFQVVPVPIPQPADDDFLPLVAPMFGSDFAATASEAADEELTNSLAEYTLIDITVEDGIATVFLDSEAEDPPGDRVLTDAAAQLVWTLTQTFGNVDSMLVNFRGDSLPLPTNQGAGITDPVRTADYDLYAPDE